MPGFNITGSSADIAQKSNVAEPRRKHRWVFRSLGDSSSGIGLRPNDLIYLKTASRPSFSFDPVEMHHDQEHAYFAGKQSWEELTMSFYDMENDPDISSRLFDWLTNISDFRGSAGGGSDTVRVTLPSVYKKEATLELTDGQGEATEQWLMFGFWPVKIDWGELDYEANEILVIELTCRYDRAIKVI